jgi:cytochrome P450
MLPLGSMNRVANAEQMFRDPYGFYRECLARYGDPFTVALPAGDLVMTADPKKIEAIFTAAPDSYEVFAPDAQALTLGEQSIFLLNEPEHTAMRRILGPLFGATRLRAYGPGILAIARRHIGRHAQGEPFIMQDVTMAISLEIIVQLIFGVTAASRVDIVCAATRDFLDSLNPALAFYPKLRNPANAAWRRFCEARDRLDGVLGAEISARRDMAPDDSMIAQMLAAADENGKRLSTVQVRDQLVSLLLAGHETTAISIAWAFYWLSRSPVALARLQAEFVEKLSPGDDPEAINRLSYLGAVCSETMRLWPIGTEIPRRLRKPLELGGYVIPAGAAVAACTVLTHERDDVYPDPAAFQPERFLTRKYTPYEYLPFGGGARRCIAAGFGTFEMKMVLAAVLREWDLDLIHPSPVRPVRRNLIRTLGPEGGVPMRIRGPAPRCCHGDGET